jgi:hypothetical protein
LRPTLFGRTLPAFEALKRIIPVALKDRKPGTVEFREAIHAALLTEHEIPASQASTISPKPTATVSTTAHGSS